MWREPTACRNTVLENRRGGTLGPESGYELLSVDGGPAPTDEVRRQHIRVERQSGVVRLHTRQELVREVFLRQNSGLSLADIEHERVQVHETFH